MSLLTRLSLIVSAYLSSYALLWSATHISRKNPLRALIAWSTITLVLLLPIIFGRSDTISLNLLLPTTGFLLCMRIYEIVFIRPEDETRAWSKGLLWCHMMAFPLDDIDPMPDIKEPSARTAAARRHSLYKIIQCLGKILIGNALMNFVPSSAEMAHLKFYSVPYLLYYYIIGWALYFVFSGTNEMGFATTGLVFGVWMKDMFHNPLMASTPRDFWSKRWNLAIKDLFHKVLFSIGQGSIDAAAEHKKTDGDKPIKKNEEKKNEEKKGEKKKGETAANGSKKPSPLVQSILAFGIFAFSGLMHEYINYCAFDILSGENMLYFLLNGIACFVQVKLEHTYPSIRAQPRVIKMIFTFMFFLMVGPLFSEPYMRAGFFDFVSRNMPFPVQKIRLFG